MTITVWIIAIVIIACLLCNQLSTKFGIPMLLAFIILGMVFGSDGVFKIPFDNFEFAEQFSTIALIFIIFYGGFGTNWKEAKQIALPSILLSSFGVLLTAILVGVFAHYALSFSWQEGLLIGAVLSSTDAASVFSLLRSKRLNLKFGTASMLELESGSNDPWAYMMTIILLSISGMDFNASLLYETLFAQIGYGLFFGIIIACGSAWILTHIRFANKGFDTIFIVAIALVAYATPALLDGNGYLSVYLVGIVLGNYNLVNQKALVHFFDGTVGLLQILIFFLLGLLAFPSQMGDIILPAIAIFLFMSFLARPLIITLLLAPFHAPWNQRAMVAWSGLRGATSIVFAIMVQVSDVYTRYDVFHIAFCIVLLSIGIQGTLLPYVAKKLHMIDSNANVMKTFSDYREEAQISFLCVQIQEQHPWMNQRIKDIIFPPDVRIAVLFRQGEKILPRGDTILLVQDDLILSTTKVIQEEDVELYETRIGSHHPWVNQALMDLNIPHATIIFIRRNDDVLLPNGDLILQANDDVILLDDATEKA